MAMKISTIRPVESRLVEISALMRAWAGAR